MKLSRRSFATLMVVFGITACKTSPTPSQVAQDISLVSSAFQAELPNLTKLVPVNIKPAISAAVADMAAVVSAFATADTQVMQQPLVQRIMADVNAVFGAVTGLTLPASVQSLMNDVNALLPIIELAVGLIVGSTKAAAPAWSKMVTLQVDPSTARIDLRRLYVAP